MNEAQVDADAAKLQAISDEGCKGCQAYIDLARDLRAKKQHADVASLRLDSIGLRPDSTHSQVHIDLLIDEAPSKTLDSKGKVVETFDGGRMTIRTTLRWANDSWRVEQALLVTA